MQDCNYFVEVLCKHNAMQCKGKSLDRIRFPRICACRMMGGNGRGTTFCSVIMCSRKWHTVDEASVRTSLFNTKDQCSSQFDCPIAAGQFVSVSCFFIR